MKIRKFLTPNTSTSLFDEIVRLDRSVAKLEASMIRLEQTIAKSVDSSRAVHSGRQIGARVCILEESKGFTPNATHRKKWKHGC